ncbi:MAG: helix-turn-helix transcriptional regulator [Litorimonas sp.]
MQKFLGSQVKVFRNMRKLSQIELAERIGVSKETIGKIERGSAAPSFRTIDKLCRELAISPRSLFPAQEYVRHKSASTALEKLISKASKLEDNEINWFIDLLEAVKKKP